MPAGQVSEILDAVRGVHRQLAARYHELDESASDERIKLLLEDMERRETKFDECVEQYESEEGAAVLNTWLQFVPDEVLHLDHIAERLAAPRSLSELVEETLRLNSSLCDAYLTLAQKAPIPALRELFTDLANIEERNDCHYAEALLDE
jgi:hypothetical protein